MLCKQQRHIRKTLDRVAGGILRIGGASGSGRKLLLISLMMLAFGSNRRVLAYSHTLRALDNLAARFEERSTYGDILAVRYRGEKREVSEDFLSLDGVKPPKSFDEVQPKWQADACSSLSVAKAVLMVIAEDAPDNYKLFRLWKRHQKSTTLFRGLSHLQSSTDHNELFWRIAKDIINDADLFLTTPEACGLDKIQEYGLNAQPFVDEAHEIAGLKDLVDSMDVPIVVSSLLRSGEEFHDFEQCDIGLGWLLHDQARAEPALFDLANDVFHNGQLNYTKAKKVSSVVRAFEDGSKSYAELRGLELEHSPSSKVYPVLLDLHNCHTYVELHGTKRHTSEFVKFGTYFLLFLLRQNTSLKTSDIIVISHCRSQCSQWRSVLEDERNQELAGIEITTLEDMDGCESKIVLWDTAIGARANHHHDEMPKSKEIYATITRHTQGLIIIADSSPSLCGKRRVLDTGSRAKLVYCEDCKRQGRIDGLGQEKAYVRDNPTFRGILDWMKEHDRVIQIDSNIA
jgi:hypothetical protein